MTLLQLPPIVAAGEITDSLGRSWDPREHPRGRDGKFIRTFRLIRAFLSATDTTPWMTGEVESINPDGSARTRVTATAQPGLLDPSTGKPYVGNLVDVHPSNVESVNEKAKLDLDIFGKPKLPGAGEGVDAYDFNPAHVKNFADRAGLRGDDLVQASQAVDKYKSGNTSSLTDRKKYQLALYAKSISGDGREKSDADFVHLLDELGVPQDVTDDTPDGLSGLQWLADQENASRSPNQNKLDSADWIKEAAPIHEGTVREATLSSDDSVRLAWFDDGTQGFINEDGSVDKFVPEGEGNLILAAHDRRDQQVKGYIDADEFKKKQDEMFKEGAEEYENSKKPPPEPEEMPKINWADEAKLTPGQKQAEIDSDGNYVPIADEDPVPFEGNTPPEPEEIGPEPISYEAIIATIYNDEEFSDEELEAIKTELNDNLGFTTDDGLVYSVYKVEPGYDDNEEPSLKFFTRLENSDGEMLGSGTRFIHRDEDGNMRVYLSTLTIENAMQGQGVGTEQLRKMREYFKDRGFTNLDLFADVSVGGYAWARTGADWDPEQTDYLEIRNILQKAQIHLDNEKTELEENEYNEIAAEITDFLERVKNGVETPTPWQISRIGEGHPAFDGRHPGKRALLDNGWYGTFDLNNPSQTDHSEKHYSWSQDYSSEVLPTDADEFKNDYSSHHVDVSAPQEIQDELVDEVELEGPNDEDIAEIEADLGDITTTDTSYDTGDLRDIAQELHLSDSEYGEDYGVALASIADALDDGKIDNAEARTQIASVLSDLADEADDADADENEQLQAELLGHYDSLHAFNAKLYGDPAPAADVEDAEPPPEPDEIDIDEDLEEGETHDGEQGPHAGGEEEPGGGSPDLDEPGAVPSGQEEQEEPTGEPDGEPAQDVTSPEQVDEPQGDSADPLDSLQEQIAPWTAGKFEVLNDPGESGDGFFLDETGKPYTNPNGSKMWGKYGASGVMLRHVDDDGVERFLLVQRGNAGYNKGKWQLPGGALESKENDFQGAARELTEELTPPDGYLDSMNPVGQVMFNHPSGWHYNNIAADAPEQFTPKVDGHETSDAGWFTREEIDDLVLHPALEKNIDDLFGQFPTAKKPKPKVDTSAPGEPEDVTPEPEPVEAVPATLADFPQPPLTSEESWALHQVYGYAWGYKLLNPYLHHDKHVWDSNIGGYRPVTPQEEETAEKAIGALDSGFEKATPLDHPVIVERRSGAELFPSSESMVGDEIVSLGYTSTATNLGKHGYGYESKPVLWTIVLPAGTKALIGNSHENEVLINRGGVFRITEDTQLPNGERHLTMEYVPDGVPDVSEAEQVDVTEEPESPDPPQDFTPAEEIGGSIPQLDSFTTLDHENMTDGEATVVTQYSQNNYNVNTALRNDQPTGESVGLFDSAMGKSHTNQDMQVNRSVLGDQDDEHIQQLLNAQVGDIIHDKGFSGTTTKKYSDDLPYGNPNANARIRLKINVPGGSRAIYLNQVSWRKKNKGLKNGHEAELLLDRDGDFEIVAIEEGSGKTDRVITVNYHERDYPPAAVDTEPDEIPVDVIDIPDTPEEDPELQDAQNNHGQGTYEVEPLPQAVGPLPPTDPNEPITAHNVVNGAVYNADFTDLDFDIKDAEEYDDFLERADGLGIEMNIEGEDDSVHYEMSGKAGALQQLYFEYGFTYNDDEFYSKLSHPNQGLSSPDTTDEPAGVNLDEVAASEPGPDSEDWQNMVDDQGAYRWNADGHKMHVGDEVVGADGVQMVIHKFESNNKGVIAKDPNNPKKKYIRHRNKLTLANPPGEQPEEKSLPDIPGLDEAPNPALDPLSNHLPGDDQKVSATDVTNDSMLEEDVLAFTKSGFAGALESGDWIDLGDGFRVEYFNDGDDYIRFRLRGAEGDTIATYPLIGAVAYDIIPDIYKHVPDAMQGQKVSPPPTRADVIVPDPPINTGEIDEWDDWYASSMDNLINQLHSAGYEADSDDLQQHVEQYGEGEITDSQLADHLSSIADASVEIPDNVKDALYKMANALETDENKHHGPSAVDQPNVPNHIPDHEIDLDNEDIKPSIGALLDAIKTGVANVGDSIKFNNNWELKYEKSSFTNNDQLVLYRPNGKVAAVWGPHYDTTTPQSLDDDIRLQIDNDDTPAGLDGVPISLGNDDMRPAIDKMIKASNNGTIKADTGFNIGADYGFRYYAADKKFRLFDKSSGNTLGTWDPATFDDEHIDAGQVNADIELFIAQAEEAKQAVDDTASVLPADYAVPPAGSKPYAVYELYNGDKTYYVLHPDGSAWWYDEHGNVNASSYTTDEVDEMDADPSSKLKLITSADPVDQAAFDSVTELQKINDIPKTLAAAFQVLPPGKTSEQVKNYRNAGYALGDAEAAEVGSPAWTKAVNKAVWNLQNAGGSAVVQKKIVDVVNWRDKSLAANVDTSGDGPGHDLGEGYATVPDGWTPILKSKKLPHPIYIVQADNNGPLYVFDNSGGFFPAHDQDINKYDTVHQYGWESYDENTAPETPTTLNEALTLGPGFAPLPHGSKPLKKHDNGNVIVQHANGTLWFYQPYGATGEALSQNPSSYKAEKGWNDWIPPTNTSTGATQPSMPAKSGPSRVGADGKAIYIGDKVTSTNPSDSKTYTVKSFQNNDKGVIVKDPDTGKTYARHRLKLKSAEEGATVQTGSQGSHTGTSLPNSGVKVTPARPDPSSPWYNKEKPEPPAKPELEVDGGYVSDAWMQKVDANYRKRRLAQNPDWQEHPLSTAATYHYYVDVQTNGNTKALDDLLQKGRITQELHDEALKEIQERAAAVKAKQDKYIEAFKTWQQDTKDWRKANGMPSIQLKGMDGALSMDEYEADLWMNKHMKRGALGPGGKLSPDAAAAVKSQKSGSVSGTAKFGLRGMQEKSLDPQEVAKLSNSYDIFGLDKGMLESPGLPEDIYTTRSIDPQAFRDENGDPFTDITALSKMVGTIQHDWGFPETSPGDTKKGVTPGLQIGSITMRLRLPAGTRGVWAKSVSHAHERGFILERGLAYYIHSVYNENGKWMIEAEVIPKDVNYDEFGHFLNNNPFFD